MASLQAAPGDSKWVFPAGGAINSAPAIGPGGWVIFGSADGKVYALNGRTGEKQWELATGGAVDADPAIGLDGTVYVGSADGYFYALDGYTGAKKWALKCLSTNLQYSLATPAIGPDGTVYVGGATGVLYALDGATGAIKWSTPPDSAIYRHAPVIGPNGIVYAVTIKESAWIDYVPCRRISARNARTGVEMWGFEIDDNIGDSGEKENVSLTISADGVVYFSGVQAIYALDGATGKQLLKWTIKDSYTTPVLDEKGTLYISSGYSNLGYIYGGVYAFDTQTGQQKWRYQTAYRTRSTPAISADGTLYFGDDAGDFFALDAASGVRKWGLHAGGAIGAPTIGADGTVYVGSLDGKLYALEGAGGLLPGVGSKYRVDARNSGSMLHPGAPAVMKFLTNQLVGVAFPYTLEAVADGQLPLSYTWYYNGAPIAGATNAVLSFAAFNATNAGAYRVQVSNAFGSADSGNIMLTPAAQIAVEIEGPGKVERNRSDAFLALGTEVEFTAKPDDGRRFVGWKGELQATNPVIRLTASQSLRLRATFGYLPGQVKWSFLNWLNDVVRVNGLQVDSSGVAYMDVSALRIAYLYAIEGKTGSQKWVQDSSIETCDGNNLITGAAGSIYHLGSMGTYSALASATGNAEWWVTPLGWTWPSSAIPTLEAEGKVFSLVNVSESTGVVSVVDGALGVRDLSYNTLPGQLRAITHGTLLLSAGAGNLYSINATNGILNWVYQAKDAIYGPMLASESAVIINEDGSMPPSTSVSQKLIALNPADGSLRWRELLGFDVRSMVLIGDSVVCQGQNRIQSRDIKSGAINWDYNVSTSLTSDLVGGGGSTVVFGGADNRLHALDAITGAPKWDCAQSFYGFSHITVGSDGTIYAAGSGGDLYAVEGNGPLPSSTNAPRANLELSLSQAQSMDELSSLSLTFRASGNIADTNALRYSLVSAPEGLRLDALTGQMTWTPTAKQGPSNYVVQVKLTDTNNPSASVVQSFTIAVREVNHAPQLTTEPRFFTVESGQTLVVTNTASDADWPANVLTFSLAANALEGAQWDAATGVLSWTAPRVASATTNVFAITVYDNGTPQLSDTEQFTVVVQPSASVLPSQLPPHEGDTKWVFTAGGAINSAPAIGPGGWVIFGSADGKVYAVDGRTGEKQWEFATGGAVDADPAIGLDGTVYVGSADGFFYALDGYTGAKKWGLRCLNTKIDYSLATPAIGPDGTVYVGGATGVLFALDGETGAIKWSTPTNSTIYRSVPVVGPNGLVYVAKAATGYPDPYGIPRRVISALNANTGEKIWDMDNGYTVGPGGDNENLSLTFTEDGAVYFCSAESVCVLDGSTGKQLAWRGLDQCYAAPAMDNQGTLFIGCGYSLLDRMYGSIYASDAKTGKQKWQYATEHWTHSTPAVSSDGTVYIGEDDGHFFALDAATGVRKWGMRAGGAVGAPTIGVDGTVYVGSRDGKLYALKGSAGLVPGVCSKYRFDTRNSGSLLHAGVPVVMPFLTNQLVGVGLPYALEAVAEGQAPLSYTWFYNGEPMAGATNSVLPFAVFNATNAGVYRVQVSNALGSADSGEITLTSAAQIAVETDGPGKVERTPSGPFVPLGTEVELTAQPEAGRRFVSWNGDPQATNPVVRWAAAQSLNLRANFGYMPGQVKWKVIPVGDDYRFAVWWRGLHVDAAGVVYASVSSLRFNLVYAVEGKTGVKKWAGSAGLIADDGYSFYQCQGNAVYVMGSSANIASLAHATGLAQWTSGFYRQVPGGTTNNSISEDTIFGCGNIGYPGSTNIITALDGVSGRWKWSFAAPPGSIIAQGDGSLYLASSSYTNDTLYDLNALNGATNWIYQAFSNIISATPDGQGRLFVSVAGGQLVALKTADGSLLWKKTLEASGDSLVLAGDQLIYKIGNRVQACDPLTGTALWEYTAPKNIISGLVKGLANRVYFGGVDKKLHALDNATGEQAWESEVLPTATSLLAIGPDGTLYAVDSSSGYSANNTIYAIEGDGPLASTNVAPENLELSLSQAQSMDELSTLSLTFRASGDIADTNALRYTLVSAPEGLSLDALTGQMTWTPTAKQGPSNYVVQVKLTDTNNPSASVVQSFTIAVREVNHAPTLTTEPRFFTVEAGQSLVFTNTAMDLDWPLNALAYSLETNALEGAQLDAATGVLRWSAPAAASALTNVFAITVYDNATPKLSDTGLFTVVVTPPAPALRFEHIERTEAGAVSLTWATVPGASYQLQSAESLDAPLWANLGEAFTAPGPIATQVDTNATATQRFYRVVKMPAQ